MQEDKNNITLSKKECSDIDHKCSELMIIGRTFVGMKKCKTCGLWIRDYL